MAGAAAYGSGQARAAYRQGGHDTVIKPKPLNPAVPGGFTLDDFVIDDDSVSCPARNTRPISPARTVTFGRLCQHCPLRAQCTTAKTGRSMTIHAHQDLPHTAPRPRQPSPLRARCTPAKTGRSMTIHEHEDLLRAARAQAKTPQFKRDYPTRSNIERTIAHTATQNGRRVKLRYLGTTKNNAWLHTRAAALNLRTLLAHGLTRTNDAWTTAYPRPTRPDPRQ